MLLKIGSVSVLLVFLVSCAAGNRTVDLDRREAMSPAVHSIAQKLPFVQPVTYGNWGGPGSSGGEPVDAMDELFRRHDLVYYLSMGREPMRCSDYLLIEQLQRLDASTLDETGILFRDRSIRFLQSPVAGVLGKPARSLVVREEPPGRVFSDAENLKQHMRGNAVTNIPK